MKKSWLIFLIFLTACSPRLSQSEDEEILARVSNKYLYKSDLKGLVPENTGILDSINITHNYINNWVRQELILQKAEANLSDKQKNFERQLNNYRNSLLIYAYESSLIQQNLDTIIHDNDIKDYYENNRSNFELKENIVKVNYFIAYADSLDKLPLKMIRSLIKTTKDDDLKLLQEYSEKYALDYFLEDQWIYFSNFLEYIPLETYNQEAFLNNQRYIEFKDSLLSYFVYFKNFKIKESVSPLSLQRDNIRDIILNKRKLKLIETMRQDIFEDAMKNNEFEIY
jgi:hypothetical protein